MKTGLNHEFYSISRQHLGGEATLPNVASGNTDVASGNNLLPTG
jgi:hypothetical protein